MNQFQKKSLVLAWMAILSGQAYGKTFVENTREDIKAVKFTKDTVEYGEPILHAIIDDSMLQKAEILKGKSQKLDELSLNLKIILDGKGIDPSSIEEFNNLRDSANLNNANANKIIENVEGDILKRAGDINTNQMDIGVLDAVNIALQAYQDYDDYNDYLSHEESAAYATGYALADALAVVADAPGELALTRLVASGIDLGSSSCTSSDATCQKVNLLAGTVASPFGQLVNISRETGKTATIISGELENLGNDFGEELDKNNLFIKELENGNMGYFISDNFEYTLKSKDAQSFNINMIKFQNELIKKIDNRIELIEVQLKTIEYLNTTEQDNIAEIERLKHNPRFDEITESVGKWEMEMLGFNEMERTRANVVSGQLNSLNNQITTLEDIKSDLEKREGTYNKIQNNMISFWVAEQRLQIEAQAVKKINENLEAYQLEIKDFSPNQLNDSQERKDKIVAKAIDGANLKDKNKNKNTAKKIIANAKGKKATQDKIAESRKRTQAKQAHEAEQSIYSTNAQNSATAYFDNVRKLEGLIIQLLDGEGTLTKDQKDELNEQISSVKKKINFNLYTYNYNNSLLDYPSNESFDNGDAVYNKYYNQFNESKNSELSQLRRGIISYDQKISRLIDDLTNPNISQSDKTTKERTLRSLRKLRQELISKYDSKVPLAESLTVERKAKYDKLIRDTLSTDITSVKAFKSKEIAILASSEDEVFQLIYGVKTFVANNQENAKPTKQESVTETEKTIVEENKNVIDKGNQTVTVESKDKITDDDSKSDVNEPEIIGKNIDTEVPEDVRALIDGRSSRHDDPHQDAFDEGAQINADLKELNRKIDNLKKDITQKQRNRQSPELVTQWKSELDDYKNQRNKLEKKISQIDRRRKQAKKLLKGLYKTANGFDSLTDKQDILNLEEQIKEQTDKVLAMVAMQLGIIGKDARHYEGVKKYQNTTIAKESEYLTLLDNLLNGKIADDVADDTYRNPDIIVHDNQPSEPEEPTKPVVPNFSASDFTLALNIEEDSEITGSNKSGLTYEVVTTSTNGYLTLDAQGNYSYTPDANFNGIDSYRFKVTDSNGLSDTFTVNVTVGATNDAPVTEDSTTTTDRNEALVASINASDVDGDILNYRIAEQPSNGTVTFDDGLYTYKPNLNYTGSDSFTVKVDDGNGGTAQSQVSVAVKKPNDYDYPNVSIIADKKASHINVSDMKDKFLDGSYLDKVSVILKDDSGKTVYFETKDINNEYTIKFNINSDVLSKAKNFEVYALDSDNTKSPIMADTLSKQIISINNSPQNPQKEIIVLKNADGNEREWAGGFSSLSNSYHKWMNKPKTDNSIRTYTNNVGEDSKLTKAGILNASYPEINMIPDLEDSYKYIYSGVSRSQGRYEANLDFYDEKKYLEKVGGETVYNWVYGQPIGFPSGTGNLVFKGELTANRPADNYTTITDITGTISLDFSLAEETMSGVFQYVKNGQNIDKTEFNDVPLWYVHTDEDKKVHEALASSLRIRGFFGGDTSIEETGGAFEDEISVGRIAGIYKAKNTDISSGISGKPGATLVEGGTPGETETNGQAPNTGTLVDNSAVFGNVIAVTATDVSRSYGNDANREWSWSSTAKGTITGNNTEQTKTIYGLTETSTNTESVAYNATSNNITVNNMKHTVTNSEIDNQTFNTNLTGTVEGYNYLSWGKWDESQLTDSSQINGLNDVSGHWVRGLTPTDMPSTGSASYAGDVKGSYIDSVGTIETNSITGDIGLNVEFATGNMDGNLKLQRNGSNWADAIFAQDDAIKYSGFAIDRSNVNVIGGGNGEVQGFFAGPNVEEVGGSFSINKQSGDKGHATGVFVGNKQ